jgi:hypothetical protein
MHQVPKSMFSAVFRITIRHDGGTTRIRVRKLFLNAGQKIFDPPDYAASSGNGAI